MNVGANIYDYMDYIVNNYDNLPEIMLFGKTNMFERHITKEEFEKVKDNKTLTLLLTQNHRTYSDNDGVVCYYENGLYYERNDFWYLREHPTKTVNSKNDLVKLLNLTDKYIGFAPGGCCIVPRQNILKQMESDLKYPIAIEQLERKLRQQLPLGKKDFSVAINDIRLTT